MSKSPEQFYSQHGSDAKRLDKAKDSYEKHLEEARQAADLTQHPELWDQASNEYQAEAREKMAEAAKGGDYDRVAEIVRGLRDHAETIRKNQERQKRGGLEAEEYEKYQRYVERVASYAQEIADSLTKKQTWRRSALLFDKTGSVDELARQQMIECAVLALDLEKAVNQQGVSFGVTTFSNPEKSTPHKALGEKADAARIVQIIKNLERRDGEGPTEEARHLEKVFQELSEQGEKDKKDYPKDIIYFTDGETNNPQRTREALERIGASTTIDVLLIGGAGREGAAKTYQGIKGVRVIAVPQVDNLPFAFGEILKAKYAPELLVAGKDPAKVSGAEAEAKAEERIEKMAQVEPQQEIRKMFTEHHWQHALDKAKGLISHGPSPRDLNQLAETRMFDPERFDKNMNVEAYWKDLERAVESEREYPIYFVMSARDLKMLNPKLFEERFKDRLAKEWRRILGKLEGAQGYAREFLPIASAIKDLDPEMFEREVAPVVKKNWGGKIRPFVNQQAGGGYEYHSASYAAWANNIKPEAEKELGLSEYSWGAQRGALQRDLQNGDFHRFFYSANRVASLKVLSGGK